MTSEKTLINCKVCKVRDEYTLVLNVGKNTNIRKGFKFLVYSIGEEIFDPDTKESLGNLEIIKGEGTVIHVQDKLCTIESSLTKKVKTTVGSAFMPQITSEDRIIPFEHPSVGDFAKYIP